MHNEDDTPLSDEELALAKKGETLIAAAVADTQAPQSLRESIERDRELARAAPKATFWRRNWRALTATATAAAALAVVGVVIQSGTDSSTAPTLAGVQAAARLAATQPAPSPKGGTPPVLAARVGAISFPDWQKSFGWKAVGAREDSIAGRTVKTVFYRNPDGARLGYSVVAGEPLREHPPGREVTRAGNAYHVASDGEHTLVTWTQQGHTCTIFASATVPDARLVDLAASRNS